MTGKTFSADKAIREARARAKGGDVAGARALYDAVLTRFPQNRRAQQERAALPPEAPVATAAPVRSLDDSLAAFGVMAGYNADVKRAAETARRAAGAAPGAGVMGAVGGAYTKPSWVPPKTAEAQLAEGEALMLRGQYPAAIACFRIALDLAPGNMEVLLGLGQALRQTGDLPGAVDALRQAVAADVAPARALCSLGIALIDLDRHGEAVEALEQAAALAPDMAEAHSNLGVALAYLGRTEAAVQSYETALRLRPDYAAAHKNLSALKTYRTGDAQMARMDRLVAAAATPEADRMLLHFALGKACEDIGNAREAFRHFAAGNRLCKAASGYDIAADRHLFAEVRRLFEKPFPPGFVASKTKGEPGITPIFILGMPRSGTSLIEQVLASHSAVHAAGELTSLGGAVRSSITLPPAGPAETPGPEAFRAIRAKYLRGLQALEVPQVVVTDKLPLNFRWIGFILMAIPEAKIVHLRRDPVATCWSNFKHHFPAAGNEFSCDLRDLADYYKLYSGLMDFWHRRFPGRIHDIGYEAFTENQRGETENLLAYCGLPFEPGCLAFHKTKRAVATLSATQVRRELYTGSSEEWRRYADDLGPLLQALARE